MADATNCLSDAAKAVVDRTMTRLQDTLTQDQLAGLKQLASNGQLFDVEALLTLADFTDQPSEATYEN